MDCARFKTLLVMMLRFVKAKYTFETNSFRKSFVLKLLNLKDLSILWLPT